MQTRHGFVAVASNQPENQSNAEHVQDSLDRSRSRYLTRFTMCLTWLPGYARARTEMRKTVSCVFVCRAVESRVSCRITPRQSPPHVRLYAYRMPRVGGLCVYFFRSLG